MVFEGTWPKAAELGQVGLGELKGGTSGGDKLFYHPGGAVIQKIRPLSGAVLSIILKENSMHLKGKHTILNWSLN